MIKRIWLLLCLLCMPLASGAADEAEARFAEPPAADRAIEGASTERLASQADAVARVKIAHVNSVINPAMSRPGMLAIEAFSYQLLWGRVWKGESRPGVELWISLNDCPQKLEKGEEYLVFVQQQGAQWTLSGCQQVIPAADAEPRMVQLDRIFKTSAEQIAGLVETASP
ncbi:hypothetical protein G8770_06275 [Aestuariicella hydrocarbonica]|uniref:DUF2314 domain-containing protein n=1 Tax=Pseudomaricurvus hydrocarbonicus TaxID=1470433 RepID=A0A9E5JTE1_9GAMM|nr:hypothetical protein [Aestuariicella hydrocarbonica]NHO65146.1 hypothetical protein [Aestuariicella hydrocarbonica]